MEPVAPTAQPVAQSPSSTMSIAFTVPLGVKCDAQVSPASVLIYIAAPLPAQKISPVPPIPKILPVPGSVIAELYVEPPSVVFTTAVPPTIPSEEELKSIL